MMERRSAPTGQHFAACFSLLPEYSCCCDGFDRQRRIAACLLLAALVVGREATVMDMRWACTQVVCTQVGVALVS